MWASCSRRCMVSYFIKLNLKIITSSVTEIELDRKCCVHSHLLKMKTDGKLQARDRYSFPMLCMTIHQK